jgi:3-methyladenine DNA glycosylase AlkD
MTSEEVLHALESLGSEQTRRTYLRHGVQGELYGVSYAAFGKLAKRIRVDHALARELWATGNHDARVLATMVADPARMDAAELDAWVQDLTSYPISDAFAGLAARAPAVDACRARWMASDEEWVARTGWLVFARRAQTSDGVLAAELDARLAEIERDIHARPNRVRDAMNSALIGIGVGYERLRDPALAAAGRIGRVQVDHGDTGCKTPDAADSIRKTVARQAGKSAQPAAGR